MLLESAIDTQNGRAGTGASPRAMKALNAWLAKAASSIDAAEALIGDGLRDLERAARLKDCTGSREVRGMGSRDRTRLLTR